MRERRQFSILRRRTTIKCNKNAESAKIVRSIIDGRAAICYNAAEQKCGIRNFEFRLGDESEWRFKEIYT